MVVVTHALVRAELIAGRQAPPRGYALTKDPSEMRLFDTIKAVERLFPAEKGDTFPMRAIKEILRVYAETAWDGLTIGDFGHIYVDFPQGRQQVSVLPPAMLSSTDASCNRPACDCRSGRAK